MTNDTKARLLSLSELQGYLSLGRNKAIEWGKVCQKLMYI